MKAQPDADKTLNMILSRLDDMKAEETVTIDLRGKSAFSDYMIVTTGRVNRHVGAIAENVAKGLKETGIKSVHVEGLPNCDWVLIDSGDVIVHVFRPEVREFYNLERLWTQIRWRRRRERRIRRASQVRSGSDVLLFGPLRAWEELPGHHASTVWSCSAQACACDLMASLRRTGAARGLWEFVRRARSRGMARRIPVWLEMPACASS